jgi:hypothetical protein
MSSARPTPTIAVIAVPGPGDPDHGGAARAVADLLLRLRSCGRSRYTSFVERALRIPTKPAHVNPRSAPNVAPDLPRSVFAEQHPFLRTQLQYGGAAARDREEDSPDHQFMRAQLAEYRSGGEPYDSVRLEGERLSGSTENEAPEPQARLHVYELRWADLSRLQSALLRRLAELYRLCLHIAHLGRTALDHARLEHPSSRSWRLYGLLHTWAVRLLTVFVPAVYAVMLVTILAAALPRLAAGSELFLARLVLAVWLAGAGVTVCFIFGAHERLRPGALPVGLGAYALTAGSITIVAAQARRADDLIDGTLRVFEATAVVAATVWDAIFLLGALAGAFAIIARSRSDGTAHSRAMRAARTANATLAIATASTLVVTFVIWALLLRLVGGLFPARPYAALVPIFGLGGSTYAAFFERLLEVTAGAGVPIVVISASALMIVAALGFLPSFVSEVRAPHGGDAFQQTANGSSFPAGDPPLDADQLSATWAKVRRGDDKSERGGRRLTRGFRIAGAAVTLLYLAVFFVAPAASIISRFMNMPLLDGLEASASTVVLRGGGCLVAATLALIALRSRFPRLTCGFGQALDVVLEVDAYLRTHPRVATPRAHIAERYVSLLRYLCQWRDRSGRPYDAVIIVAHSQGAVITADLLSFVQREEDPELEPIRRPLANGLPGATGRRLFVFTMGSPLRQLYSEWFPHLFGWVRGDTGDGVSRPLPAVPREPWMLLPRLEDGHRVQAPAIPDGTAPDPYAMGVTRWVNAYRSDDYVGRAQWRHAVDGCDWIYRCAPADAAKRFAGDVPPVTYVSEDAHRSRRELCIGAGAHTHYWDSTGKAIALELDLLISDATKLAVRVSKDTAAPAEGMES